MRLIAADGEQLGVVTPQDALARAREVALDVVVIAEQAQPPVCKIMDFGKFTFEKKKKEHESKRKQKVTQVKEVKFRPNIDDHDYEVKMRMARNFIGEGDKVKVTLRFRGREMAHQELGVKLLERIRTDLGEIVKVESMPRLENRQMIMVLAPK